MTSFQAFKRSIRINIRWRTIIREYSQMIYSKYSYGSTDTS